MSPTETEAENSSSADRNYATGFALAVAGTFLFAMKSIWIKSAFEAGGSPTLLLALRMTLSAPFYVAMLLYLRQAKPKPMRISVRDTGIAASLGFFGYYLASFLDLCGLEILTAQLERLTLFSYPTMIAVLAWLFFGEPLTAKILAALALCYAGIFVMYSQEAQWAPGDQVSFGVLLVLGSALSYSIYITLAKPMIQKIGSREFTSYAMLGSAVFIAVHAWLTSDLDFRSVSLTLWGYGILLAFVCTVIPSFMINEAIGRIGATQTTIIGSIGPVMTMILAISLLGEPTSIRHILGMSIVIVGVLFVSKR